jgi:hypothetical protein
MIKFMTFQQFEKEQFTIIASPCGWCFYNKKGCQKPDKKSCTGGLYIDTKNKPSDTF